MVPTPGDLSPWAVLLIVLGVSSALNVHFLTQAARDLKETAKLLNAIRLDVATLAGRVQTLEDLNDTYNGPERRRSRSHHSPDDLP